MEVQGVGCTLHINTSFAHVNHHIDPSSFDVHQLLLRSFVPSAKSNILDLIKEEYGGGGRH